VTKAPQSSPAPRPLPIARALQGAAGRVVRHLLPVLLLAAPAAAQVQVRIADQTPLLKTPEGPMLGRVERGVQLPQGRTDRKAIEVTVEGWIYARSLSATTREGFNAIVNDGQGQNLRADPRPDARLLGRFSGGALLQRLETKDGWAHVRRQGWVARLAVANPPASAPVVSSPTSTPAPPSGADTSPRPAASALGDGSRAVAPRGATLTVTAGGATIGQLSPGGEVRVVTRANGWSRVRVEAWVPDSALDVADPVSSRGVTAAEVRAEPARWIGQVVEWKLQIVAVQVADNLRPELPEGKPYLLTRGPLPESGFVYVLVTPEQAQLYRNAPPLREITARVRIRAPSSKYLPTPVVELIGEQ
jgi:hypothetical protein